MSNEPSAPALAHSGSVFLRVDVNGSVAGARDTIAGALEDGPLGHVLEQLGGSDFLVLGAGVSDYSPRPRGTPASPIKTFNQIADEQGWSTETRLQLLRNFISLTSSDGALDKYAACVAATENEPGANTQEQP